MTGGAYSRPLQSNVGLRPLSVVTDNGEKAYQCYHLHSLTRKLCYRKDDKWIEWAVAEIWPFEIIQDGGLPPTWIWCNRK